MNYSRAIIAKMQQQGCVHLPELSSETDLCFSYRDSVFFITVPNIEISDDAWQEITNQIESLGLELLPLDFNA